MKRNKFFALFLVLAILFGSVLPVFAAEPEDGELTEEQEAPQSETETLMETIYIENAEDFIELAQMCRLDTWSARKNVILKADISLEDTAFSSIPSFAGYFDGNGYTISGFYLTDTLTPSGLFGKLDVTGVIRDLTVSGTVSPAGDGQFVGGIVGENYGTITGCVFTGNVAGSGNTGGIAGINALSGKILDCNVSGIVIGSDMTGGIAGCNLGSIADCINKAAVNTVSVDPTIDPADINFDFLTDVSKLTSLDVSSAATDTGGIAGYSSGIIKDCTNRASVGYPHVGYNVGGIVGRSCGYVSACGNTAEVTGRKDVGGIAGQMEPYIAKNLTESELAKLERQLQELDTLLDSTMEHAENASDTLTNRLNGIASSVSSAASAAQDIRTTGTITSTVTGSVDGSTEGNATVTPVEGEIGGGIHVEEGSASGGGIQIGDGSISGGTIHVGEGSVSAGVSGSVSGSLEGEGNTAIGAGLDAQTQIDISTNMAGLASALYGMAGQMGMLSGELSGASEELLADAASIKEKINEITTSGFDLLMGNDEDDIIIDDSTTINIDLITLGKVYGCTNSAIVTGDINVGGIVGDMGLEYSLDPEDDLNVSIDRTTKRKYEVRAVIQRCKNTGTIQSKRNYAGGIAGKMDLGLIAQCEAYGSVSSESGNYVGGIAGICSSTIRHCFAKCSLSGGKYIGGIVGSGVEESKTGTSSTVAGCYAMVTIAEHEQYIGAISGAYAGTFLENYFVSEDLDGINHMSYTGCAQPMTYTQLLEYFEKSEETTKEDPEASASEAVSEDIAEDTATDDELPEEPPAEDPSTEESTVMVPTMELPEEFQKFNLTFVVEGEVVYSEVFDYGATFPEEIFPEIPKKTGYYAYWDHDVLKNLRFDTTVTAVYEPYISALASSDVRNGDQSIFFAEGDFGETDTFTVTSMALTPGTFPLINGIWDAIGKSLRDGKVSTEVVEQWQLQIPGDDTATHRIRYLPPNEDAEHMDVYALMDGEWVELDTEVIGSYVTFSTSEHDASISVVHSTKTWWAWLIVGALLLALVILIVWVVRKHWKPKPIRDTSEENGEKSTAGEEIPPPAVKKRRWLTPVLMILALLLGILGTSAFFMLPELIADKGAYEAIIGCLEKESLSMELQVDAQIGSYSFPITADIQRNNLGGEKMTSISQQGKTLYYADGTVFMENGNAYRIGNSLPDYSNLLEQAMELYRYVDVKAVDNTYSITAQGEDAKVILKLLIPSSASVIGDTDRVYVDLITEDGELSQIRFQGSGHLGDPGTSNYNVNALLRIRKQSGPMDIPDAVKNALNSGAYEEGETLSEDLYHLLSGWQKLNGRDFWSAEATLSANCGALELQEELNLYRWIVEDTAVYAVQENGYGLYLSGNRICDRYGNTVSASKASNVDALNLVEILYSLCMNATSDCIHSGESDTYTLTLDSEGMESLTHAIAPETEKMNISFTSGSVRIVMEGEQICRVEIGISGSVQAVLSKADASITAALDFTEDDEISLPETVKTALTGEK